MWLQIISGLSQKGHREFNYGPTGTEVIYKGMLKKEDI